MVSSAAPSVSSSSSSLDHGGAPARPSRAADLLYAFSVLAVGILLLVTVV